MYNFYTPKRLAQGRPHIGIYTLQTGPFSTIRQQNTTVGVSLTVVFSFVLQKNSHFGVLRSFEAKILPHRNIQRTMKYWMYFEDDGFSVGNKIDSKPCKSLYEAAQFICCLSSPSLDLTFAFCRHIIALSKQKEVASFEPKPTVPNGGTYLESHVAFCTACVSWQCISAIL